MIVDDTTVAPPLPAPSTSNVVPEVAISVRGVGKMYRIYDRPQDRLKQMLLRGRRMYGREFWALRDVSFEVARGETLGIIGRNGSGKSTLLQIIAGTLAPSEGEVTVNGRVAALLELGSGFNPEFTGRENVFLNGAILGLSHEEMEQRFERIVAFAEIGDFIDQPVKFYSSGMMLRLAFAVSINVDAQIVIVDEALAVGDIRFTQKCFRYFEDQRAKGTTFILVTHDMQAVLKLCDKVILLDKGQIDRAGYPIDIVDYYYAKLSDIDQQTSEGNERVRGAGSSDHADCPASYRRNLVAFNGTRYGNRKVEIIGFATLDRQDRQLTVFTTGDSMAIELWCRANEDIQDLALTFQVTDRFGAIAFGQNSYMATRQSMTAAKGQIFAMRIDFPCSFFQGEYLVSIGATACNLEVCHEFYDFLEGCMLWTVNKPSWRTFHGVIELPTQWRSITTDIDNRTIQKTNS